MPKQKKFNYKLVLILAVASGIIYNSWPLGFILDVQTAHYGLASDLEKVGHPYYWFFIACDIICALVVLTISYLLYRHKYLNSKKIKYIAVGLAIFAVFTALAALLPQECNITPILKCRKFGTAGIGIDAISSTAAAIGLFIALIAGLLLILPQKSHKLLIGSTQLILVSWLVISVVFADVAINNNNTHFIQQILLILSGLVLIQSGLVIYSQKT